MYLVVIALSALVLTLTAPVYPLLSGRWALTAVAGATTLPPLVGVCVARYALRRIEADPAQPARGQAAYARGMTLLHGLLALGHGGVLLATDWLPSCRRLPVVGEWPAVPGTLALAPLLTSVVLVWIALYPADRAVRQIALELYLMRGRPLRPVWRLVQYVVYNLRHQVLFVLAPMLLILLASDIIERYAPPLARLTGLRYAADLLIGAAAIGVAVITPAVLRYVWVTQRLPDGPLRDRLLVLADKLRLRVREILVWRSGGMLVNAAVMGVVAPLRYVLITDGMLEQMDDAKIEAVFGHEAGHVKRHHILFFLLFACISGCAATVVMLRTQPLARPEPVLYQFLMAAGGAALLLKWGVLFGWLSRRFERQADVFGVRTLALSGLPCAQPCLVHGAGDDPAPAPQRGPLCTTAAHVFSEALHEVAVLNGIRPEARSWRHSSISSRSRFVQELAQQPDRLRRFERRVGAAKAVVLVAAAVCAAWAAHDLGLWRALADMAQRLT
jgi:STE24 endopeptidase